MLLTVMYLPCWSLRWSFSFCHIIGSIHLGYLRCYNIEVLNFLLITIYWLKKQIFRCGSNSLFGFEHCIHAAYRLGCLLVITAWTIRTAHNNRTRTIEPFGHLTLSLSERKTPQLRKNPQLSWVNYGTRGRIKYIDVWYEMILTTSNHILVLCPVLLLRSSHSKIIIEGCCGHIMILLSLSSLSSSVYH